MSANIQTFIEATDLVISEGEPIEVAVTAYRELVPAAKRAASAFVMKSMAQSVKTGDFTTAQELGLINEAISAKVTTPKATIDPRIIIAQRIQALNMAADALATKLVGFEDYEAEVGNVDNVIDGALNGVTEWETDLTNVEKAAIKFATIKTTSTKAPFDGVRRSVADHIVSAFEDVPEGGFLKVSEIVAHKSVAYGDDSPSAGAIQARLFPAKGDCTVPGIEAGFSDNGRKGAFKA